MIGGWLLQRRDDASVIYRLPPGAIKTVGRATRADFILDAPMVSRVHCRLTADRSDQLIAEDLDSRNGMLVNGTRVSRHVLKAGDVLTIGRVEFEVKQG
jgi:pSer/pThr/pTyr-binding forkhead associated (FHA) protein